MEEHIQIDIFDVAHEAADAMRAIIARRVLDAHPVLATNGDAQMTITAVVIELIVRAANEADPLFKKRLAEAERVVGLALEQMQRRTGKR